MAVAESNKPLRTIFAVIAVCATLIGLGWQLLSGHPVWAVLLMILGVGYLLYEVNTSTWTVENIPAMLRLVFTVVVASAVVAYYYPRRSTSTPLPSPTPTTIAQFSCDMTPLPIDVKPGADIYLILPRNTYTADLESFHNDNHDRLMWPASTVHPIFDTAQECTFINRGSLSLFNLIADFKIEFDVPQGGAMIKVILHRVERDSLKAGESFTFFVVNQSKYPILLYPPSDVLANVIGDRNSRSIPLTRRRMSPLDALPFVSMFASEYKWDGNKIVGKS